MTEKRTPESILLDKIRATETPERSVRWYKDLIRKLGLNNVTPEAVMRSDAGILQRKLMPGNIYCIKYDPKTKDKLPYYDTAPLIIPFRYAPKGFYAINLHYLPPVIRLTLLNKLMTFATTPNLTPTTILRLKWEYIENASRFPGVKFSTKRYLYEHVQSQFFLVNPTDWRKVILLPTERFEKASLNKVYSDARKAINK